MSLKFDTHSHPLPVPSLPFAYAVRIGSLDGFDEKAEFPGNHAEQEDDSLFVYRGMD